MRPTTMRRFETTATGGKKEGSSPRRFEIVVRPASAIRPTVVMRAGHVGVVRRPNASTTGMSAMSVTVKAPSVTCSTPTTVVWPDWSSVSCRIPPTASAVLASAAPATARRRWMLLRTVMSVGPP
jgi:hypothetical protein